MTTPPQIDLTASVSSTAPQHGDRFRLTYVVSGNGGVPAHNVTITGGAVIGGVPYTVQTTIIKPAVTPLDQVFNAPSCDELPAFTQVTSTPEAWEVTIP